LLLQREFNEEGVLCEMYRFFEGGRGSESTGLLAARLRVCYEMNMGRQCHARFAGDSTAPPFVHTLLSFRGAGNAICASQPWIGNLTAD
jgi:hypothetical protein